MESLPNEPEPEVWLEIAPVLDAAVAQLGEADRNAIVLRFYQQKPLAEVGRTLGLNADAAQKRVNRALEKLRAKLGKSGVTLGAALIASAVTTNSVQAAPAALAAKVTVIAANGAATTTSITALVKGTLKTMAWMKFKFAVMIGAALLFTAGAVAIHSLLSQTAANHIAFEAEGTVTYATAPDPRGTYTDTKHFMVTRVGNRWKIRTITLKEERTGMGGPIGDSLYLFYEMGFDGTNIYRLLQQDEQKVLSPVPVNERYKWVSAEGDVMKSDSPPGNDSRQFYSVWLPYCSKPYFRNLKDNNAVSPAFATRDFIGERITKMQSPAKWKTHDNFFMNDVSWLSDGTFKVFLAGGKETTLKYQPPYDFPFVWARYENLTWTNWNGISLPSSFKITVSRPDYESTNVAKFVPVYTMAGRLDQIRTVGTFSPVPKLTIKTHITDWRNANRRYPDMFLSTNFWEFSKAVRQQLR